MIAFEIKRGVAVRTPQGAGVVAYVRMAPPSYATVAAASVILDSKLGTPGYSGTVFPAEEIKPCP